VLDASDLVALLEVHDDREGGDCYRRNGTGRRQDQRSLPALFLLRPSRID
jgi:hypothetical protein